MSKVMAVFAHPDDETFICGGTLAKYGHEGNVVLVCATLGEMGRRMGSPLVATRETIGDVRKQELQGACEALKIAELCCLGLRDKTLEIVPFTNLVDSVLEQMILDRPDTVITFHHLWGGHHDHCAIGAAAWAAFRKYQTEVSDASLKFVCSGEMIRNPERFGIGKRQLTRIDVTPYLPQKLEAYRAHRSQSYVMDWVWGPTEEAIHNLWSEEYLLDAAEVQI